MRHGDFADAFLYNSSANQSRLGSAATFGTIVRGNASFAALAASEPDECTISAQGGASNAADGATAELHAVLHGAAGEPPLRFAFQLSSEGAGAAWEWKTEGVTIVC